MSNRIEKVNSLLEHEIGRIILKEFDFSGTLVTLTHVETTGNLIEAKAYISVMPSASAKGLGETQEEKEDNIISILNKNVYKIQKEINKKLNMRPIPKIIFVKDEQIAEAAKVEELLNKLKKE